MTQQTYRDLIAWQIAGDNALAVYETFKDLKDYAFKDQIQRAAVSVMNNIAEGSARGGDKSFRNFVLIARGSNTEVESMVILAHRLGYIDKLKELLLLQNIEEAGRLLSGLARKLATNS